MRKHFHPFYKKRKPNLQKNCKVRNECFDKKLRRFMASNRPQVKVFIREFHEEVADSVYKQGLIQGGFLIGHGMPDVMAWMLDKKPECRVIHPLQEMALSITRVIAAENPVAFCAALPRPLPPARQ